MSEGVEGAGAAGAVGEGGRFEVADWVLREAARLLVGTSLARQPLYSPEIVLRLLDRLAAVEALADEWESLCAGGPHRYCKGARLRAALAAQPTAAPSAAGGADGGAGRG